MTAIESTAPRPQLKSRAARHGGQRLPAPFYLRCGAMLLDYIALASIVVFASLIARVLGGGARTAGSSAETMGLVAAITFLVLNLIVLPGFTGLTLGKWATGLRIEKNDGGHVNIFRVAVRHLIGYPLSLLLMGLGFLMVAFTVRGRGLHDIIAGTVVVREGSM